MSPKPEILKPEAVDNLIERAEAVLNEVAEESRTAWGDINSVLSAYDRLLRIRQGRWPDRDPRFSRNAA